MGENVVQKLGKLDLSAMTVLKLVLVAVLAFTVIAIGRMGSARLLGALQVGADKVKSAASGGAPATAVDPRYAGI